VVAGAMGGRLMVFDPEESVPLFGLAGHTRLIQGLACFASHTLGRPQIVSVSEDGTAKVSATSLCHTESLGVHYQLIKRLVSQGCG
jgi:hypothetical protein